MNKKEKIKLYIKKRPERISVSGYSIRFDWIFIVVLSFVIGMSGLIHGAIVYQRIVSGKSFEQVDVSAPETLAEEKRIKIEKTVSALGNR